VSGVLLRLHYAPNSCALAAHLALEEAGLGHQLVKVDFAREQQKSPEFMALNPLGRVPVLQTPHGPLTEVPAILGYIAALAPEAGLVPADPFEAAQMASFNAFLSSTLHVSFAHHFRPYRWADDEHCRAHLSHRAIAAYAQQFGLIERFRFKGPWVMGGQFTVADPYLFLMTRWLLRIGLDAAAYPRIREHFERMAQRPAVRRVLPYHPPA